MAPQLNRRPVRIDVDRDRSEQGYLLFADGFLVAVISHLEEAVPGEMQDSWHVEAGFGPCKSTLPAPIFESQEEAEDWVSRFLH
jgi:hypothetical protein